MTKAKELINNSVESMREAEAIIGRVKIVMSYPNMVKDLEEMHTILKRMEDYARRVPYESKYKKPKYVNKEIRNVAYSIDTLINSIS